MPHKSFVEKPLVASLGILSQAYLYRGMAKPVAHPIPISDSRPYLGNHIGVYEGSIYLRLMGKQEPDHLVV